MTVAVHYTKGGNWKPTFPDRACERCAKTYAPHSKTARYCSRKCASQALCDERFAASRTERTCPGCGETWLVAPSNKSTFCSKECIFASGKWIKPRDAECDRCGVAFKSKFRKHDEHWERFCSSACATDKDSRIASICINCGIEFLHYPKNQQKTCSRECSTSYFIRDRAHAWTGGLVLQNGRKSRKIDREGYQAKYDGEHRLIVAREIGRPLERGECVLCLDKNHANLDPSNLFYCPSQSEMGLILSGATEWPTASNLASVRVQGYVRPNVLITLHEWVNGKRRTSERGSPIRRHPQADEIIKRRIAGASVRELAREFETAMSAMAVTIKNRL